MDVTCTETIPALEVKSLSLSVVVLTHTDNSVK